MSHRHICGDFGSQFVGGKISIDLSKQCGNVFIHADGSPKPHSCPLCNTETGTWIFMKKDMKNIVFNGELRMPLNTVLEIDRFKF